MAARRRSRRELLPEPVVVEALAHDGRGLARIEGKAAFIAGALPGERVRFLRTRRHRRYDEGECAEVLVPSAERVAPRCPHFGVCGGCSLQHLDPAAQVREKQGWLLDNLRRIGGVAPREVLPPLTGPVWGYRRRARLGVRDVPAKGRVLVGFRERGGRLIADLRTCPVLHPWVGERLEALSALVGSLSVRARLPQIEVAIGDEAGALVFRHLAPLAPEDRERLRAFGAETGLQVLLQPGGPEALEPLDPEAPPLAYAVDGGAVVIRFQATDFTQVNAAINRAMVAQAMELLDPRPGERVLELFAGLGNFTLPLARRAGAVVSVEGEAGLVARARANAEAHGACNVEHHVADLARDPTGAPWLAGGYDAVLLDPPRSGAEAVVGHLGATGARRILYVSCGPATLARDAAVLAAQGYRLAAAGVMDMFPHTAHVESMALFERA
ncbi:23S rRNA (uracil(1939)-C(5))-methyltransferase RlmD [Inmirania thermothiophila]|uniref:23S rRNA (uracil(1939)-C(5))-methyltransferase RlmD n=1 Tax=Inmirania thermothiophila TaxID=1750597 RepID=A0A3N1Y0T7_9GAMM|nr:23S rRNA (uracil(1939)-C(5))-methyltransferase RlmD [Inmirania thermothiophila]ROR32141.1 23S rRNA m(5)U-1939 methyltransferase [Inmirania thermothiophila]